MHYVMNTTVSNFKQYFWWGGVVLDALVLHEIQINAQRWEQ